MRANSLDIQQLDVGGNPASGGIGRNLIINGGFDIWQRGTSQTTSSSLAEQTDKNFTIHISGTYTALAALMVSMGWAADAEL